MIWDALVSTYIDVSCIWHITELAVLGTGKTPFSKRDHLNNFRQKAPVSYLALIKSGQVVPTIFKLAEFCVLINHEKINGLIDVTKIVYCV